MKRLLLLIVLVYVTVVVTILLLSGTLLKRDISRQPLIPGVIGTSK